METPKLTDALLNQFRCPTGKHGKTIAAIMNQEHSQLTDWGLTHIKIAPNANVLDIGVGGGRTVGKLATLAFNGQVVGIDISRDMVNYSRTQNSCFVAEGKILLINASVDALSFKGGSFDCITAVETYYFWPSLPKAFREIHHALKAGGKLLLISEMIKDGKYEEENKNILAKTGVKLYPLAELQGMLQAAGFLVTVSRKNDSAWNVIVAQKQ